MHQEISYRVDRLNDVAKASARGSFFLFLGNTSSTIILASASILVARLLGPENYGLYAVAMITPSILIALIDLGVSPALTRFSASLRSEGKDRKAADLIKAGTIFKLILSLLLALSLLPLSDTIATHILKRPSIGFLIRFTSLYLVGQAVLETVNSVFIGLDKTENSGLLMNVQAVTKAVASPLLIILGLSTVGAILGAGVGSILAAGIGAALLLLRTCPALYRHSHGENIDFFHGLGLMVSYGMPLYLSSLILSLLAQYHRLILALFVSNMEIGNYAIAINFSALITLLSYPIATSLFPAFSKVSIKADRNMVEKMFKLSIKYTSLLVIPASFAVAMLSNEVVYALYGSQYALASSYLALYILSFLCAGLGMFALGSFFNGQGDTRATLRINLINLSFSVPLAFIMTFLYGVPGLIVSLLASHFLSATYGLFLARKRYAVTIDWVSSLRIGAASLSSALLVYVFITFAPIHIPTLKLAVGGSLFLASFLAFAPLLGAIDKQDISTLDELVKGIAPIYPIARRILNLEKKILSL